MTVLAAVQQLPDFKRLAGSGQQRFSTSCAVRVSLALLLLYRNRRYFFLADRGSDRLAGELPQGVDQRPIRTALRTGQDQELCHLGLLLPRRTPAATSHARRLQEMLSRSVPARPLNELLRRYFAVAASLGFRPCRRWRQRSLGSCSRQVPKRSRKPTAAVPGFRQFIDRQAFEITLITALPQKARRLAESIECIGRPDESA